MTGRAPNMTNVNSHPVTKAITRPEIPKATTQSTIGILSLIAP